jgi:hypothetical protein
MKKYSFQIALINIALLVALGLSQARANTPFSVDRKFLINRVDSLPPDSLNTFLRNLNLSAYTGVTVDSFLHIIPNIPNTMFVSSCVMGKLSMYNACYLQLTYSPDFIIRIYVNVFSHLPQYSSTLTWDVNLFRLESIYKISIYKDNACINGRCLN